MVTESGLGRRVTATLIVVSLLAVLTSTLLMLGMSREQFSLYIDQNNQAIVNQWSPVIVNYYAQNGFTGLQEFLVSSRSGNGMGMGQRQHGWENPTIMNRGQRMIITDNANTVMADSYGLLLGQTLDLDPQQFASSVLMTGETQIGTLYITSPLGSGLATLENSFVNNLTLNACILALLLGVLALAIGWMLGRRISLPIKTLSEGIHKLAQGKLDERIILEGDQEFINLGNDFNLMAAQLEDAEKNRRRLTADISHELRTPLALIRGQLEGIQHGFTPMNSENLTLVVDEVIRLSRLVKELEELSLVQSKSLKLHITTFPLTDLLEKLNPVIMAMQAEGIDLIINIDPDIKEISADQDRLLQILLNLLANAMHHVKNPGKVFFSIKRGPECLTFSIADNGPGIPAEDLPHIFERFYRIDDSRNRTEGGMGLGLAIALAYTEAHKGRMWAESELGTGSVFYFTLPQEYAA